MGQANDIAERWWALYLAGKIDEAQALSTPDTHFRAPGAEFNSREALKPYLEGFHAEFSKIDRRVKTTIESGELVFTELELVMTHRATGKQAQIFATDVVRVVNGKIVAWHAYWDRVGFGGQLQ